MSSEAVVEAHAVESTIALAAHKAVGRVNLPLLRDVDRRRRPCAWRITRVRGRRVVWREPDTSRTQAHFPRWGLWWPWRMVWGKGQGCGGGRDVRLLKWGRRQRRGWRQRWGWRKHLA